MIKQIIILLITFILFEGCYINCDYKKPIFNIVNESDFKIDSILLIANSGSITNYNADTLKIREIMSNNQMKGYLDMYNLKSDGGIFYCVFRDDSISYSGNIDYFTNGASMKCEYFLNIKNDTIIVTMSKI